MSRLDEVLRRVRDVPPPPVACAAHAPVVARVLAGEDAFDAFAEIPDCPACAAAVAAHPYLCAEALDMALPMPGIVGVEAVAHAGDVAGGEGRRSAWLATAVLLAAAVLLAVLGVRDVTTATAQLDRPGPRVQGAALYPYMPPVAGPTGPGRALSPAVVPWEGRRDPEQPVAPLVPVAFRYHGAGVGR